MQQLSCAIVDDEPLPAELLVDYIKRIPFLKLEAIYTDPLVALANIQQKNADLIFLDIQMPQLSGIQFMQLLRGKSKVIIISAYPDYALQGYELDVVDYLVKPVSFERFLKAAGKAFDAIYPRVFNGTESQPVSSAEQVLFVKTDRKMVKILPDEILFLEGMKEYIAIHTKEKKIITLQTLKKMETVLDPIQFIRVHKSFIVAMNKIDAVEGNHILIKAHRISIGETYKYAFIELLNSKNIL